MINLQTGKTIDMIQSRNKEDVAQWLKGFPNIEYISRDGSNVYKSAITEVHPQAIQISDRFHLMQNLTDYAKKEIVSLLPRIIKIVKTQQTKNEEYYKLKEKTTTKSKPTEAYKRRLELIKKVKKEYTKVGSIRAVARNLRISKTTATNYLRGFTPTLSKPRTVHLDIFKNDFIQMIKENKTTVDMHEYAVERGLTTKYSNTRSYVAKLKDEIKLETISKYLVEKELIIIYRKDIVKLLFNRGIRDLKLKETEIEALKLILKNNPRIQLLIDLVTEFRIVLFSKESSNLEKWIKKALKENYKKINIFIKGIKKDYQAVLNAIDYYLISNGLIEGKINKLKNIKRVMYGRCSFNLLKRKIFLVENQLN